MKKLLLIIAGVILFLPLGVKAAEWECPGGTSGPIVTCYFKYDFVNQNTFSANLTALGGAIITEVSAYPGQNWVGDPALIAGDGSSATISLANPEPKNGLLPVITVKYTVSGHEDCGISITPTGGRTTTTPGNPSNPKTGASLPYLLVGTGAILALGIYLQTSKKEKFYKI